MSSGRPLTPLVIATRGSALALWQANHLREALDSACGVAAEILVVKTSGDRFTAVPLEEIGVKGVFTKELEDALIDGRADLAVHSMKDVPTEFSDVCRISTVFRREDPRDVLVSRDGGALSALPRGARVGTSSLRRSAQLRATRPDLATAEIRGNVDTRLRKLDAGNYDAIVLAKAGVDRLGLSARITEILPPTVVLPAAGQGALGVEWLAAREEEFRFLDRLVDTETVLAITAERAVLAELQGGCRLPLGAWARFEGGVMLLDACVLSVDGSESIRGSRSGVCSSAHEAEALGRRVASELLDAGAEPPAPGREGRVSAELKGKRVVLTRAAEHSAEWIHALESRGAEVLLLPAVRIAQPETWSLLDRELLRLDEFDWILFTSRNAVRFVAERLGELSCELAAHATRCPRIAAVGQATAEAIRQKGWKVDVVAPSQTGESLACELRESLAGRRVLLPRSDRADDRLPLAIEQSGAKVREVVAYLTLAPESLDRTVAERLERGDVDWIVFASPSAFHNLAHGMGEKELVALSARVHFLAIGLTTARALREAGVHVEIEASSPSAEGVSNAICEYYTLRAAAGAPVSPVPSKNAKMRSS